MQKLSATIITYNEEENIERCIHSVVNLADEILVVDSFSSDRTVEIAESLGAKVLQNPFEGFIQQRDFCIKNASHDLVLALDCDEAPDENLKDSILKVKTNPAAEAFLLNRLSAIGDQFIYHGNWHPDHKIRLFFRESVKVGGVPPHDSMEAKPNARVQKLKGKLLHFSDRTRADRIIAVDKHTTTAAHYLFSQKKKTNLLRIYLKPIFRFISGFIFKRGFLDGSIGFFAAKSEAIYVFRRENKLRNLWKKNRHHD